MGVDVRPILKEGDLVTTAFHPSERDLVRVVTFVVKDKECESGYRIWANGGLASAGEPYGRPINGIDMSWFALVDPDLVDPDPPTLVERLRIAEENGKQGYTAKEGLLLEAADQIENMDKDHAGLRESLEEVLAWLVFDANELSETQDWLEMALEEYKTLYSLVSSMHVSTAYAYYDVDGNRVEVLTVSSKAWSDFPMLQLPEQLDLGMAMCECGHRRRDHHLVRWTHLPNVKSALVCMVSECGRCRAFTPKKESKSKLFEVDDLRKRVMELTLELDKSKRQARMMEEFANSHKTRLASLITRYKALKELLSKLTSVFGANTAKLVLSALAYVREMPGFDRRSAIDSLSQYIDTLNQIEREM